MVTQYLLIGNRFGLEKHMGKIRDYYLIKLGIAGELMVLRAARHAPFSNEAVSRELKSMTGENLIHIYRSSDGTRVYRLSDPAGYSEMKRISPALLEHAEMVVGEKGKRYPGNTRIRAKKIRDAAVVSMMTDIGISVDGISSLLPGAIYRDNTKLRRVIGSRGLDETFFLSGALLRKAEDGDYHTRRELTTSSGVLVSPGGIYQTYSPHTSQIRFKPVVDTDISLQVKRMCEELLGRPEDKDTRLRAVFYPARTKVAAEMQARQKQQNFLNPTQTYKMCYVVPRDQNAYDVTKMLTLNDWFSKTNRVLGLSGNDEHDGITAGGKPIHNLLCNNIGKIEELRYQIENHKAAFLVHDWQKDIIEEAYMTKIDAITITETQFKGLLKYVEEMEG